MYTIYKTPQAPLQKMYKLHVLVGQYTICTSYSISGGHFGMGKYGNNIREELLELKSQLKQTEEAFEDIGELARTIERLGEQILGIRDNREHFKDE